MIGITTLLLYVESESDEESFAWHRGKAFTTAQHAERAQIHRELADIVERAESDQAAEWGRAVRSGDRLLVEVDVSRRHGPVLADTRPDAGIPAARAAHPLTATIVVSVARPDTAWSDEAATEIAAILREEGLDIAVDRLARAFAEGWSQRPALTVRWGKRGIAAAGGAMVVALWWILSAGWMRRRHRRGQAPTSGTPARAKVIPSKEQG